MFEQYFRQVQLLVRCLPEIAKQECFALKGGTAINLFVREFPRISVDIDLTYLPMKPRDEALQEIHTAMPSIATSIRSRIPGAVVQENLLGGICTKLIVSADRTVVKIEPNLVFRGSVYPSGVRELVLPAQQLLEAFVSSPTLSEADLYGGKICAALDRQHPRDLFDVRELWNAGGLTDQIRRAFVIYLAGHPRPMSEVLNPRVKNIEKEYETQFAGMTTEPVPLKELVNVQHELAGMIRSGLSEEERLFLLSLKRGEPEWSLLGPGRYEELPALQWKVLNIQKMSNLKREEAYRKLERVLRST